MLSTHPKGANSDLDRSFIVVPAAFLVFSQQTDLSRPFSRKDLDSFDSAVEQEWRPVRTTRRSLALRTCASAVAYHSLTSFVPSITTSTDMKVQGLLLVLFASAGVLAAPEPTKKATRTNKTRTRTDRKTLTPTETCSCYCTTISAAECTQDNARDHCKCYNRVCSTAVM